MQNVLAKLVLAAALTGLVCAAKPTAAVAAGYDGNWVVRVITERGNCDHTSIYNVRVARGIIEYTSYTSVIVYGTVAPNGAAHVSIRHFNEGADGSGLLSERTGSGGWRGVGQRGVCSGRWEAYRR